MCLRVCGLTFVCLTIKETHSLRPARAHTHQLQHPWREFLKLGIVIFISLFIGTLPWIDNWAHLGTPKSFFPLLGGRP